MRTALVNDDDARVEGQVSEWRAASQSEERIASGNPGLGVPTPRRTSVTCERFTQRSFWIPLNSSHVTDSYLLALARVHDGQLATFDRRLVADSGINGS